MLEGYEELTQQEQEQLQEIIRLFLSQTFLLERKYEKRAGRVISDRDYDFCERHRDILTEYFKIAGILFCQDSELGVFYIQGAEGIGERLPKLATIYLLLLKLLYDEKMAAVSASVNIVVTLGELNGKAGEFRLMKGLPSMTEMRRTLTLLKKYQMLEVMDSLEELSEESRILIYPTINLVLMREEIETLLQTFAEEEDGQERLVLSEEQETYAQREEEADMTEEIQTESGAEDGNQ